jgi:hypothetical protein
MSIADTLITGVIWILQNTILKILPTEFSFLSFNDFTNNLNALKPDLVNSLSGVNQILPVNLLLIIIFIIITGEVLLFGIKAMFWLVNIVRGSGG